RLANLYYLTTGGFFLKLKLFNHTGIAGGLLIYLALLDKSSSKEITKKVPSAWEIPAWGMRTGQLCQIGSGKPLPAFPGTI
ncbi:hypothetical protein, partial [Eubacterium pyruvativorans]|uniref:hypothetical protein n=1 Tax=Eubacterium pyruvativorans TaxID=155865 RepID=UPI001A9A5344